MDLEQQRTGASPSRPPARAEGDFTSTSAMLFSPRSAILWSVLFSFVSFIAIFSMDLVPSSSKLKNSLSILHQVPEGHVGVYFRGGALLKTVTDPGFHLKMPLITHFEPIQVTLKTDLVRDIPCGTKGGFMIKFEKIEVVNRLHKDYVYETLRDYGVQYGNTWIYDNILHEIIQFCSVHSFQQVYIDMFDQIGEKMKDALQADCNRYVPGIQIISVRVTKPSIPDSIRRNFEQMEKERTKVLVAVERQRVAEKEAETRKKIAISEAEKNVLVSKIQMEQKLMEKDTVTSEKDRWDWLYPIVEKILIRHASRLDKPPWMHSSRAAGPQPRPQAPGGGDFTAIVTVLLSFIAIFIMILVPSSSTLKSSLSILHQVPEGHVGVYWRGGALLKTITDPGFHLKMPLITHFEPTQVTLQTDLVRDIPCGTKGGVMINFEKIEVVNRLHKDYVYETLRDYGVQYDNTWIYDKIHHEINQFCSVHSLQQVYIDMFDQIDEKMKDALQADCTRYAPGIQIISVRVTKPSIPDTIRRNFVQMEEERTKVLIAVERQRVAEKEAETHKKIAISEAEKNA
ncbi:hypothetical protein F0562_033849 [Nyssa sinensis]|uniref:Band 7 domain-containing protein n=1 Tax=Nyssa sinensis TaxID=561372 RepID=A0A5J5AHK3_9ASTE|nr:hypothetical protein F0562_033849 [Nyssa sinensis]